MEWFPKEDKLQAVRMRRFLMTAGSSLMVICLAALAAWHGMLEFGAFLRAAIAIVFLIGTFYVLFRTGLNRRFADTSLTVPQIVASVLVISYLVFSAREARATFLLIYMVSFVFGMFHLRARQIFGLAFLILTCHAAVMALLWLSRPETSDLHIAILQWIIMAAILSWFASRGAYLSTLREKLRTSNRELEDALRTVCTSEVELRLARDAAEAASRAKGEFLAHMSHEIRTPMNAIMGMTDLALETPMDALQREYLMTVKSASGALLAVINDVLDFSRIEAGRLDLECTEFALGETVSSVLRLMGKQAREKGWNSCWTSIPRCPASCAAIRGGSGRCC